MSAAHAGLVAATMRAIGLGGGGSCGFMGGTHAGAPFDPHCSGARVAGIMVVAFPARAKAAYTVLPSGLTANARGLSPNTGMPLIRACVLVSNTSIWFARETLTYA